MSLSPASSTANSDADSTYHEDDVLICLWKKCNRQFDDAETMYSHLSVDHVGRKSTGNLCLDCCWDDCDVRTSKRDHITSHLRVHVPLKPHVCETCKKAFKRPQDLKKHYKIHSESHQQQLTSLKNHRISRKLPSRPPTPPYYHPYHIDHHHRHHHHSNNCNNDNNHQEFQPQPQPQPPRQCYADELSGSPIISGYNNSSLSPYSNPSSPASSFSSSPRNSSSSLSSSLSASPISSSINSLPIHTTNTITSPTLNSISLRSRRPGSMSMPTTTTTTNMDYQETFYPPPHIQHIHQSPSLMPSLINRDGSSPKSISNERLPSISYALSHAGSMPPITGFPQKDTFLR